MMCSRRQEVRLRWPMLVSALLHVLVVLALNLLPAPGGGPHVPQERPYIQVAFTYSDQVDEALTAKVPSEILSHGPRSDGLETYLAPAIEAHYAPEGERVFEPSAAEVGEASKPPDPPPTASITPQSVPSAPPSRPTVTGRRKDITPRHTPAIQPQVQPPSQEQSAADQSARLPEPTERVLRHAPDKDHHDGVSSDRAPGEAGLGQHRHFGRVPLLSGSDLDKYAKLPAAEQGRSVRPLSGLDAVISLDTKDIRYLSYFAHLKHRIEQAWSYPAEAVAGRMHGRLVLLFVLQRSGQVKRVELLRSSGSKVLDKEAWDAVTNAAPFDPFPPQIPQEELQIRARFSYILEAAQQQTTVQ
jgi:protein TonB